MMRRVAWHGPHAGLAAAAQIRAARAAGARVEAAWRPAPGAADPACEFVAAHGALWDNQAFWLEWATGRPLDADPVPMAGTDVFVMASAAADGPAAQAVPQDRFGRPMQAAAPGGAACRIGIVGSERHHRMVYPAVLAALGDAADRAGVAVEPVFVTGDGWDPSLAGIILPGGSDMAQVALQIEAARLALEQARPAFGLCLGMQSMATLLMRQAGWPACWPEEVAGPPERPDERPDERRSFVRWHGPEGGRHRLGDRRFQAVPGTRLATLLPAGARIRMNHRYRLNPDFRHVHPAGAVLHATGEDGIVDAVELPGHPFFIGLQGHPELGCDPAVLGLWDAFIQAACGKPP